MNAYKITFEDGSKITTRMNATLQEAKEYYIGQFFEIDEHRILMGVMVEQLKN